MNGNGNPQPGNEITIAGMFTMSPENIDPDYILLNALSLPCWHFKQEGRGNIRLD